MAYSLSDIANYLNSATSAQQIIDAANQYGVSLDQITQAGAQSAWQPSQQDWIAINSALSPQTTSPGYQEPLSSAATYAQQQSNPYTGAKPTLLDLTSRGIDTNTAVQMLYGSGLNSGSVDWGAILGAGDPTAIMNTYQQQAAGALGSNIQQGSDGRQYVVDRNGNILRTLDNRTSDYSNNFNNTAYNTFGVSNPSAVNPLTTQAQTNLNNSINEYNAYNASTAPQQQTTTQPTTTTTPTTSTNTGFDWNQLSGWLNDWAASQQTPTSSTTTTTTPNTNVDYSSSLVDLYGDKNTGNRGRYFDTNTGDYVGLGSIYSQTGSL